MHKLMWKFLGYGLKEMYRGIFIGAQVKQLQRYVPELTVADVTRLLFETLGKHSILLFQMFLLNFLVPNLLFWSR